MGLAAKEGMMPRWVFMHLAILVVCWSAGGVLAQSLVPPPPIADEELRRHEAEEALRAKQQVFVQQPLHVPDNVADQDLLFNPTGEVGQSDCLALDSKSWVHDVEGVTAKPLVGLRFPQVGANLGRISTEQAGRCVLAADLDRLLRHVQARLVVTGFPMVQVTEVRLDPDSSRALRLSIRVPLVTKITLQSSPQAPALPVDSLFGSVFVGDVLNSFDLDQAIENVRAGSGSDLLVRVIQNPDAANELVVQALHQKGPALSGRYEIGTSAAKTVHPYQSVFSVTALGMLWPTDDLRISLSSTPFQFRRRDGAQQSAWSADYAVGHGAWRFSVGLRQSNQVQDLVTGGAVVPYRSLSSTADFRVERVLYRTASSVVRAKLGIGLRHTDVVFGGESIEVQRRRLAPLSLGLGWRLQTPRRYVDVDLTHTQSPRWLGAQTDFPVVDVTKPNPSFRSGFTTLSLYSNGVLLTLGQRRLVHDLYLQVQHASRAQYDAEQFQIGPQGTVRGFAGRVAVSGEVGVLARNDFSLPNCGHSSFTCYFAIDWGSIRKNYTRPEQQIGLAGVALGVKWAKAPVYLDVSMATPVWQSGRLGPKAEKPLISGRVSVNF